MKWQKKMKRIFKRKREPEIFVLERYEDEPKPHWEAVIEPIGREPSFDECEIFMVPSEIYRLRAQGLNSGKQRTVWGHKKFSIHRPLRRG